MIVSRIEIVGGRWDGLKMGLERPMPASEGERLSLLTCDSAKLDALAGNEAGSVIWPVNLIVRAGGKAVEM